MAVFFSLLLASCKKANYAPRTLTEENQWSKEESEPLLPNEMLETEGLRLSIKYPPGTTQMAFKLFKPSPNRSEIKLGIIEESREYYILSKHLSNNSDFILSVEYGTVANNGAFQLSINGILSLKGPSGLNLPRYSYTPESSGVKREFLRIRKGRIKYAFFAM